MKKRVSAVMAFLFCFMLFVPAANAVECGETYLAIATNNTIVVSNSLDTPDAHEVHPAVYKIEGANYFKLRDVAMLLKDSAKQFAVDYDEASGSVLLTTGKPYTAKGGELSGTAAESASAIVTNNQIYIDGEPVTLKAFKIDGANYFKLRDLGEALDFRVGYDEHTRIVYISGARGYEKENAPVGADGVAFTAKYFRTNGYHSGVSYPIVTVVSDADALARYYEENRARYDLSGGFAEAMKAYLLDQGIPENDILLESESKTTYENLLNSKKIVDIIEGRKYTALVTSNYHVYRALRYCRKIGLQCTGIGSHVAFYYWPSALIREFIAIHAERKHAVLFFAGWIACMISLVVIFLQ